MQGRTCALAPGIALAYMQLYILRAYAPNSCICAQNPIHQLQNLTYVSVIRCTHAIVACYDYTCRYAWLLFRVHFGDTNAYSSPSYNMSIDTCACQAHEIPRYATKLGLRKHTMVPVVLLLVRVCAATQTRPAHQQTSTHGSTKCIVLNSCVNSMLGTRGPPPLTAFLTFMYRQRYILK